MTMTASAHAVTTRSDHRPRVLIVDDDTVIRMLLQDICQENGWTVVGAATAADAILAAGLHELNLVLLDFHLGDADALSLLGQLRIVSPTTPIVVLTGEQPEGLSGAIKQAGGDGVVGKPCSVAQVAALLDRYRPAPAGSRSDYRIA